MTEFLPSQEQKCEETFWKSCKIDFRESPYNYTMKHCHIPLIKECDDLKPTYSAREEEPKIVCQTWFESECNTTVVNGGPNANDKANTWCKKVPKKICAPDNCKMVPGAEECHEKVMVSTIEKPSEICDLQPQRHCRLITRLVPHLMQKEVCREVPKEVCHLALANPHKVKRPMQLKWCTRKGDESQGLPQYETSYLPPAPSPRPAPSPSPSPTSTYKPPTKFASASSSPLPSNFALPTFSQPGRPPIQFQLRETNPVDLPVLKYETKFKPLPVLPSTPPPLPRSSLPEIVAVPPIPVSISDDLDDGTSDSFLL